MFLSTELKLEQYEGLRQSIPRFAEKIISERMKVRKWLIQRVDYDGSKIEYACIVGDEDDAISLCFILKLQYSSYIKRYRKFKLGRKHFQIDDSFTFKVLENLL